MYVSRRRANLNKPPARSRRVFGYISKYKYLVLLVLIFSISSLVFISYTKVQAKRVEEVNQQKIDDLDKKLNGLIEKKRQEKIAEEKRLEAARKAEEKAKTEQAEALGQQTKNTQSTNIVANDDKICTVSHASSIHVVLNKKHCLSPIDWAPDDLVTVASFLLRSEAARYMEAMMNAASADGHPFSLTSTYRSYYDQINTYNYWVNTLGSQAQADTISARPGFSEHQTGLTADLQASNCVLDCFGGTSQYQWLLTNASNYGYIERYPEGLTSITGYSPEAWHWRYVGVDTARDMKDKGIQTLEQYFGIEGGDYR